MTVSCSHGYYIQNLPKISVKVLKRALFVVVPLGIMFLNVEVKATTSKQPLPFDATPEGFQTYLNNIKEWQGADTIVFENPKMCRSLRAMSMNAADNIENGAYQCKFDYEKYSALGQQVCINNEIHFSILSGMTIREGECGKWQKVEELPLVGLTEQEVKEHDEYEQKNAKPKKSPVPGTNNLSIFAGLLIASFSGAAIFAVIQKILNKLNKDKT